MGKRWSEDDDIYLEYFAYENDQKIEEAAKFLGRSTNAVAARLVILRKRNEFNVSYLKKRWTQKEDEFIKKNYMHMSNASIAENLHRTAQAVSCRKRFLGLRKNDSISVHRKSILKMIEKGYFRPEIARKLGVSLPALTTFLNLNNIYCKPVPYEERTRKIRSIHG